MSVTETTAEAGGSEKGLFLGLPSVIRVGFAISILFPAIFEWECMESLSTKPWLRTYLPHPLAYPFFILAPWAYCAWGLWHLSTLASRDKISGDVIRLMGGCLLGILVFSYLLAWQWSEFTLVLSKVK